MLYEVITLVGLLLWYGLQRRGNILSHKVVLV